MLEQKIRVFSETLARGIDRRAFLRRLGGTMVAGVSALVVGPALMSSRTQGALASPLLPTTPQCSPPGPYCNVDGINNPTGCKGGHCFQHLSSGQMRTCQVYYAFYPTGCWTSASGGGYWTCCDCQCSNGSTCGCAQYNPGGNPNPL